MDDFASQHVNLFWIFSYTHKINLSASRRGECLEGKKTFREAENFTTHPGHCRSVGHDITAATPKGTKTLDVSIGNGGETPPDCMTPVANVVQVQ